MVSSAFSPCQGRSLLFPALPDDLICFSFIRFYIYSHVKEAPGGGRVRMNQLVDTRVNTCSRQAKRSGDR